MSGWRDISSAPKDGTPILTCIAGPTYYARSGWWDDEVKGWAVGEKADGGKIYMVLPPTHWMPLPEPPEANAA